MATVQPWIPTTSEPMNTERNNWSEEAKREWMATHGGAATHVVTFEPIGSGTRMTTLTQFLDNAQMEQMLGMGMEEGMRGAMGQIDEILSQVTV